VLREEELLPAVQVRQLDDPEHRAEGYVLRSSK
jgi:hypothetical protein